MVEQRVKITSPMNRMVLRSSANKVERSISLADAWGANLLTNLDIDIALAEWQVKLSKLAGMGTTKKRFRLAIRSHIHAAYSHRFITLGMSMEQLTLSNNGEKWSYQHYISQYRDSVPLFYYSDDINELLPPKWSVELLSMMGINFGIIDYQTHIPETQQTSECTICHGKVTGNFYKVCRFCARKRNQSIYKIGKRKLTVTIDDQQKKVKLTVST